MFTNQRPLPPDQATNHFLDLPTHPARIESTTRSIEGSSLISSSPIPDAAIQDGEESVDNTMPPPASSNRAKNRQLVRWNDDLDKSLLLFIIYTCTDLGIKIPYDEIARRMGSTFTEGAIQQHITKLRARMAELNNSLVPPPIQRGKVTSKPSSVYGQKSRAGPPPPPPPATKARGRNTSSRGRGNGASRGNTRARKPRKVKQSGSDPGESEAEHAEEGEEYEEYQEAPMIINNNGKRARQESEATNPTKINKHTGKSSSKITGLMQSMVRADEEFDEWAAANVELAKPMFSPGALAGRTGDPNDFIDIPGPGVSYSGLLHEAANGEEDEEECGTLVDMARGAVNQQPTQLFNFGNFQCTQDEQISPTSMTHMSMPMMTTDLPAFGSMGHYQSGGFGSSYSRAASDAAYRSYAPSNFAFTEYSTSNGGSRYSAAYIPPGMSAPVTSAYPRKIDSDDPGSAASQFSTRNHSMISHKSCSATPLIPSGLTSDNPAFDPSLFVSDNLLDAGDQFLDAQTRDGNIDIDTFGDWQGQDNEYGLPNIDDAV